MGFRLEEGPAFTMHYKCSILGTDDKVLRVVSPQVQIAAAPRRAKGLECHTGLVIHECSPGTNDFRKPPVELNVVGTGASFKLTATDKAGAVRHHKSWTLNTEP